MARSFYGACIGFFIGLLIGWIIESFVMDQAARNEFLSITSMSIVVVLGFVGLVVGFFIMYVTNREE